MSHLFGMSLKFTKWGPKKSEDGANGDRVLFKYGILFQGKAMSYVIVSNNISGTHGNLKGSKLVNLSDVPKLLYGIYRTGVTWRDQKIWVVRLRSFTWMSPAMLVERGQK